MIITDQNVTTHRGQLVAPLGMKKDETKGRAHLKKEGPRDITQAVDEKFNFLFYFSNPILQFSSFITENFLQIIFSVNFFLL